MQGLARPGARLRARSLLQGVVDWVCVAAAPVMHLPPRPRGVQAPPFPLAPPAALTKGAHTCARLHCRKHAAALTTCHALSRLIPPCWQRQADELSSGKLISRLACSRHPRKVPTGSGREGLEVRTPARRACKPVGNSLNP